MLCAQGYGFVEFATPVAASRAKAMMEKIENEMRPDFRGTRSEEVSTSASCISLASSNFLLRTAPFR